MRASGEAGGPLLAEMKEVPGGSKPLRKWEYYYWGLGATGIAFLLYNRMKDPEPTDEEKAVRSWPSVCRCRCCCVWSGQQGATYVWLQLQRGVCWSACAQLHRLLSSNDITQQELSAGFLS